MIGHTAAKYDDIDGVTRQNRHKLINVLYLSTSFAILTVHHRRGSLPPSVLLSDAVGLSSANR